MQLVRCLVLLCLVSVAARPAAAQTSYDFYVLYNGGGSTALVPGYDNPVGTTLEVGDGFIWSIAAQGGSYWRVTSGGDFFPFMAFGIEESGTRRGNFVLRLLLEGVEQTSRSITGIENSFVHLGTNTVTLQTGLMWDTMFLQFLFTGSDAPSTTITSVLPIFGAPELNAFYPGIEYITATTPGDGDVVPEPATMTLFATGLAGLAAGRRRCKA